MSRELLKQAIEAINYLSEQARDGTKIFVVMDIEKELAKPEPEPVAWALLENGKITYTATNQDMVERAGFGKTIPLYTSPPILNTVTEIQDWMKPHKDCDYGCLYHCTKGFTKFPECAEIGVKK